MERREEKLLCTLPLCISAYILKPSHKLIMPRFVPPVHPTFLPKTAKNFLVSEKMCLF